MTLGLLRQNQPMRTISADEPTAFIMHTHIQQDLAPSSWLWLPPFPKPKDNLGCNVARRLHRHDIHNPEEAAWVPLIYLPCLDILEQSGRADYFRGKERVGERERVSQLFSTYCVWAVKLVDQDLQIGRFCTCILRAAWICRLSWDSLESSADE